MKPNKQVYFWKTMQTMPENIVLTLVAFDWVAD